MMVSFLTRGLVMVLGYTYPAYECFKIVEKNKRDRATAILVSVLIGKTNQGKVALDVAVRTLDPYKNYVSTPYPLPKLDMIAIPDFSTGEMENCGPVTYRETALLFDEQHSATAKKQWVAVVVAHELAHQWFGNLVTMEWWTHQWLNEVSLHVYFSISPLSYYVQEIVLL